MIEEKQKQWIQTYTGKRVDLLYPNPDVINIEDIAHALSRLCRYTGHTKRHYSVAEHSVHVSRRAVQLFDLNRGLDFSPRWRDVIRRSIAKQGLLHDATEAYLGDVSRPLKHLKGMHDYRKLESQWQQVIFERFNVFVYAPEVNEADAELLGTEASQLLPGGPHEDWLSTVPKPIENHPRLGMSAWRAKWLFMREFNRLFGE